MRRTGRAEAAAALAEVGRVGPFFAVATAPAGQGARTRREPGDHVGPPPGWRPVADLYRNVDGVLAGLIGTTGERLPTGERRVAASILFQGYAARLWSPVLGCLAMGLPLPDAPARSLHWRHTPGEPLGLLATEPTAVDVAGTDAAGTVGTVAALVIGEHLTPMVTALRSLTGVAAGLLWGNASSAMIGTLTVLGSAGVPLGAARGVATGLLDRAPLRGTGMLTVEGDAPAFRRSSCCLYYRVPGGGLCGDCCLRQPA